MHRQLSPEEQTRSLQIGVDVSGRGDAFLTHSMRPDIGQGSLTVAGVTEFPAGSLVQLQVLDPAWAHSSLVRSLTRYTQALPLDTVDGGLGAFAFTSSYQQDAALLSTLGGITFQVCFLRVLFLASAFSVG